MRRRTAAPPACHPEHFDGSCSDAPWRNPGRMRTMEAVPARRFVHAPAPLGRPVTAHLLIGPVLRRVVGDRATIWVETTDPAVVRVEADGGGAGSAHTFSAYGHHYAIVVVEGLTPDAAS